MRAIRPAESVPPARSPTAINSLSYEEGEIDLIDLLTILYREKYILLAFIVVTLAAGLAAALLMPQRWSSTAVLIPPEAPQMRGMEKILTQLSVLDVKTDITPDKLLSSFMNNFDSFNLRKEYLVNTNYYKNLVKGREQDVDFNNRMISTILNNDITTHSSVQDKDKKEYRYYLLQYSAQNPAAARDLLEGYINYVTAVVQHETQQSLRYQIDLLKGQAEGRYLLDLNRAETQRQIAIERLEYALEIARSAGLIKPAWSNGTAIQDDPDFSVTLGADGLARKLQIEKSLPDVAHLNADLQNRRAYIARLNALEIGEIHVQPFKYMSAPYQPVKKDGPRRSLILMLAGLAGLVMGCSYVLLNNLLRERRKMTRLDTLAR